MNVADLQQHFASLKRLLEAAGAKGAVLLDLDAIGKAFAPFQARSLKEFADFLVRAEGYHARGEVPVTPPKGKAATAGKSKAQAVDAAALAQEAKRLYEQAIDPATTLDVVHAFVQRLEPLTKGDLGTVADALDLKLSKSATKPAIISAIEKRIMDRKGSWQRAGLLDRPAPPHPGTADHAPKPPQAAVPIGAVP